MTTADNNKGGSAYLEVWGDTVSTKHLWLSILMGVIIAPTAFLGSRWAFESSGVDPQLSGSYSLLVGLGACLVVAVIGANIFKPKRVLVESELGSREDAMDAIEAEVGPIGDPDTFPPAVLAEVTQLGLYDDFKRRFDQQGAKNRGEQ